MRKKSRPQPSSPSVIETPIPRALKIDELAGAAGISVRAVRYYLQRGLLPPPEFRGPHTVYGPQHLRRLQAIRRLQEAYWPLDAIAGALAGRGEAEIEALSKAPAPPPTGGLAAHRAPAEAPAPARTLPAMRWRREPLAPGLELHLAETADARTQDLAAAIRDLVGRWRSQR